MSQEISPALEPLQELTPEQVEWLTYSYWHPETFDFLRRSIKSQS